ncbi:MAG: endonuclease/exonuclease/phosphatase family protein [Opitutaceae bacterium]|nr:endonuclease/exonuclease/phosphatase family protein [Opitutaceae bacterium]
MNPLRFSVLAFSALFAVNAPADPVRVLTYNILSAYLGADKTGATEKPRAVRWEKRAPALIEVLRRPAADGAPYDFIATQETSFDTRKPSRDQPSFLAAALPEYDSLAEPCVGRANLRRQSLSNMIFWLKKRWKPDPSDRGTFWLSDTPEKPSDTWRAPADPAESLRCVTFALLHELGPDARPTGRRVYLFNTHLSVRSEAVRVRSAALILARIAARRDPTAPAILTGDMNALPGSAPLLHFQGNPIVINGKQQTAPLALHDTFADIFPAQSKITPATPAKEIPPPLVRSKIDYIFATQNLATLSARRLETRTPENFWPSDHDPYEAILSLPPH